VSNFSRTADYGYSIDEILQIEMKILFKAQWQVNPPTINISPTVKIKNLRSDSDRTNVSKWLFCQPI
jgi:hypothetical protein